MIDLSGSTRVSDILARARRFLLQKRSAFYLGLILLLGASLRLFHLTYNSVWVDEGFSVWLASKDVKSIVEAAAASEDEPLYYVLLHYWMYLGRSELVLRSFSVIWSVLSLILCYETGRILFGPAVALTAALLLSISPLDVWYSQEIGRFAFGTSLALGSMYGFASILVRRRSFYWVIYVAATAAMLYTFYMSFAIVLAQNLYLLLAWLWLKRHRDLAAKWIIGQLLVATAFLPWWPRFVEQTHHVGGVSLFVNAAKMLEQLGVTIGIRSVSLEYLALFIGIGMASLLILGKPLLALWRRLFEYPYFFAWSLPSYLAVLLVSSWRPVSSVRLTLIFLPPFLLAVAVGFNRANAVSLSHHRNLWLSLLVIPTLVSLGANYFINQKENWRDAAHLVEVNGRPGDTILIHPSYGHLPFGYYYSGNLIYEQVSLGQLDQDLTRLTEQYDRIWFVLSTNHSKYHDPDNRVQKWLDTRSILLQSFRLTRINVRLYQFPAPHQGRLRLQSEMTGFGQGSSL